MLVHVIHFAVIILLLIYCLYLILKAQINAIPLKSDKANMNDDSLTNKNYFDEKALFLLKQKLAYAHTVATVCMTWWVSSVVFCGSILAAVWLKREEMRQPSILFPLGCFLALFFASASGFGAQITWGYLPRLDNDLSTLLNKTGKQHSFSNETGKQHPFSNEVATFRRSMLIGTISFLLILAVWLYLWYGLYAGCWK